MVGVFVRFSPYRRLAKNPLLKPVVDAIATYMVEARSRGLEAEKELLNDLYYTIGLAMADVAERLERLYGYKELGVPSSLVEALSNFGLGYPIIDHGEYVKRKGRFYFISHPYNASKEDFEKLIRFCNAYDLNFTVHGNSSYFPGHTFSICIYRKDYGSLGKWFLKKHAESHLKEVPR